MTPMSSTLATRTGPTGPRRWGLLFAAIWLFYLLSPLAAAWDQRDSLARLGRHRRHPRSSRRSTSRSSCRCAGGVRVSRSAPRSGAPRAPRWSLVEIALGVVMCVAIGQKGTAAAVYIAVTCVMCLQTRWAWLVSVAVALRDVRRHDLGPGLAPRRRHPVRDPGRDAGGLGHLPVDQPQHRGAAGARGERPPRPRRRAQPLRPRPPRHPRPLAHRDHGQGRARQPAHRRRPRPGPRRARRPRAALARRAGRRTPCRRRLPRADPARRAGPRPHRAVGGRDRGRPAQLHRRRADRPPRAVRLDGPRGDHQRDPAQRRPAVHRPARRARGRDPRRRARRRRPPAPATG